MLGLKALRRRIASIKSTQQITRAMKMVAAARLRRAQDRIIEARPYADKMREVLQSLSLRTDPEAHPMLARRETRKVELMVITTDRGLCGSFNQNVFRRVERFFRENRQLYEEISLTLVGRKGLDYFRRREFPIIRDYVNRFRELDYQAAATIGGDLVEDYTGEAVDAVFLVYNEFRSPLIQRVMVKELLPIEPLEVEPDYYPVEYIYEPSADAILSELLPKYVEGQIYRALLESVAGEHGARMTAMDAATENAQEMIEKLTLMYNKARQSAITKEMMEIVAGAEALR
ncbi:MAG: ATP synthase F1 subunit gamma [Deltaproteobacteria bacterium]|nr:MAG: ATP synthase F1 subunit gamma [Deltaproteobacteria bacterium]